LEAVAFHERVREGYRLLANADPERWVRIQADRPVDVVATDIREAVLARLPVAAR